MRAKRAVDLEARAAPLQERAKATVERILDATADLLDEVGVEAFNTNLLADRVGIGVRAIYRYYPNKLAILRALAERFRVRELDWVGGFDAMGDPAMDWREAVDRVIDGYYREARREPGVVALRSAMQSIPALRAVEARSNGSFQRALGAALRGRGLELPARRMRALTQVLVDSATVILDRALRSRPPRSGDLIRELKRTLKGSLADHLDRPSAK